MGRIKLLDCTLRDGGYINDWKFGHDNIVSIFERIVDSGVEIIEIGFLDDRRPFDYERSIMPDTASANKIYGKLDSKNTMVVGMIDYGTCDISNLQPCEETCIDGIRVIFKKHLMHEAMDFCAQVKKLGYKVFSQLVSIGAYTDDDLMELIGLVNEVEPYAVSMVDTYGILKPKTLLHYYDILDKNVKPGIQIGFHSHNNFQLAYANDLAFMAKETNRDIVVDGTLFGMGKSAGNAPLELLAMTMNEEYGGAYKINSLLESIDESIMNFRANAIWGYQQFFYMCAINNAHPSYATQFIDKGNLSVSKTNDLLGSIEPADKQLLYDKNIGEETYEKFVKEHCNDAKVKEELKKEFGDKKLLLVGPGKNILLQQDKVEKTIEEIKPYIIAVNYIPKNINPDCVFVTNSKRYLEMATDLLEERNKHIKLLATSNIECRNGEFDYQIERINLIEGNEQIKDNSFLMLLKLLKELGYTKLYCAGFDGFSENENTYYSPEKEYGIVRSIARQLNKHVREVIEENNIDISYVTYSLYEDKDEEHIWGH
ncbi:MAG: aldolase catalytic domain-containing protein [Pseudobutyrivibrio sp.]|nr:aldolase catalytic domain-containing protein [Pseudobutyrivibrio sp.]